MDFLTDASKRDTPPLEYPQIVGRAHTARESRTRGRRGVACARRTAETMALGQAVRRFIFTALCLVRLTFAETGENCRKLAECALMMSRGQWSEDIALLPTLLGAAGDGTFVEIGALDGLKGSNTFMLERCLGWTGLLIEGSPMNFKALKQSGRKAVLRHSAICAEGTGSVNMSFPARETLSPTGGQSDRVPAKTLWAIQQQNLGLTTVEVPCRPLTALMDGAHTLNSTVDFLSLDVEGAEDLVLMAGKPASRFKVVLVELDGRNRAKDALAVAQLRAANMTRSKQVHVVNSEVWLAPGVEEHSSDWMVSAHYRTPTVEALADALQGALNGCARRAGRGHHLHHHRVWV